MFYVYQENDLEIGTLTGLWQLCSLLNIMDSFLGGDAGETEAPSRGVQTRSDKHWTTLNQGISVSEI